MPSASDHGDFALRRCAASQQWTSYPAGLLAARRAPGITTSSLTIARYRFSSTDAGASTPGTAGTAGLSVTEALLLTAIRNSCGPVLAAPPVGVPDTLLQFNESAPQTLRPPTSTESARLAVPSLLLPAYRSAEHLVYFQRQARLEVLGGVGGGGGCPPGQVVVGLRGRRLALQPSSLFFNGSAEWKYGSPLPFRFRYAPDYTSLSAVDELVCGRTGTSTVMPKAPQPKVASGA